MKFTDEPNVAFPNFIFVRTFDGAEDMNYELAKVLRRECTVAVADGAEPMGGGLLSSGNLFDLADEAVATLKTMISEACNVYMAQALQHVYENADTLRDDMVLTSWARILRARQGLSVHSHGHSLVSGTYYVSLPKPVYESDGPEGDLMLVHPAAGSLPADSPLPLATEMHIRVNESMLFLHPAFLPHYVPPFEGGGERLAVSFDVRRGG